MRYRDGQEVRVGDIVSIDDKYRGTVVACVEDRTSLTPMDEAAWAYLGSGVMIDTDFGGLVHYPDAHSLAAEAIFLLARQQ